MLDNFKAKLLSNCGPQLIISELSQPQWIHSLSNIHLQQLTKIVEGRQGNYKIHPKVSTTIYSIIILRNFQSYNTKQAIQCLTKHYRQLAEKQQQVKISEPASDSSNAPINKTRAVLANLLLRIPSFSNYKMIVKDISPELVSLNLFLKHRSAIIKQCPNMYKQFIVNRYKHIWPSLVLGDEVHFPIDQQLSAIRSGLMKIEDSENIVNVYRQYRKIEKIGVFTRSRIQLCQKQEIDIEKIFSQTQSILKFQPSAPQVTTALSLTQQKNGMIRKTKNLCLELLRKFILKCKFFLIRKFGWIMELINFLKNQPITPSSIQPHVVIDFWASILQTFGIGFYDFDGLVGREETDTTTILTLLSALAYNDYSMNNKQQTSMVNFQSSRNQKKAQNIQIHLYSSSAIDSSYQPYLKTTTPFQRDQILAKIINFFFVYYQAKLISSLPLYKSSDIMHILSNSKNQISEKNKIAISNMKRQIMFKGHQKLGDGFETFCDEVFSKYIQKRKQKKFKINRSTVQVVFEPQMQKKQMNMSSHQSHISNSKYAEEGQFKRTNSFEMQFEGWSNHKRQEKQKQEKQQKSQMFYSIKQCSEQEEKDKLKQAADEPQFLVTPEF